MSDYFAPMTPNAFGQLRLAGGDENLNVWFSRKSRKNSYQSEVQGRPVYEPVDYIKIQQPGERDMFEGPVTEDHKRRFADRYRQFLANVDQVPNGTPIKFLFPNQDEVVNTMLDLKILTIEQLASITEQGIERLGMDGRKYVARAQQALDRSEALREVTRLEVVITDQADEIAVMKQGLERQAALIAELRQMVQQATMPVLANRAQQLFGYQDQERPPPLQEQPAHQMQAYEPPPMRSGSPVD